MIRVTCRLRLITAKDITMGAMGLPNSEYKKQEDTQF